jgi:hypothetical protein
MLNHRHQLTMSCTNLVTILFTSVRNEADCIGLP